VVGRDAAAEHGALPRDVALRDRGPAADGTAYYSQSGAVGRRLPGAAPENRWAILAGATTVWGLALRDDGMLFAGTPGAGGNLWRIDTTAAVPAPVVHYPAAGSANGVIVAPDGSVLYSDFNAGRVYRVDDAGTRTQVTAATIASANGLLVDDDGTLLVLSFSTGAIWRLTLDASYQEISRVQAGSVPGASLDGIAKDVSGRYYLGDNGMRRLLRTDASFGSLEVLLTGVTAAANIAFGKGALDCTDVYVASSGNLALFEADVTGRP
jgi:sugar lactone lactonase YvrE